MSEHGVPDARVPQIDREPADDDAVNTRPLQPVVTTSPAAAQFDAAWFDAIQIAPKGPQFEAVALIRQMRDEEWR